MEVPISTIKGVGPKTKELFHKIGIDSIEQLLSYYPKDYDIYEEPVLCSELEVGHTMAIKGTIAGKITLTGNRNLPIVSLLLKSEDGNCKCTWFRMPYLAKTLRPNQEIIVRGNIQFKKNNYVLEQPEIYISERDYFKKVGILQPKYVTIKGITNNMISKLIGEILKEHIYEVVDIFSEKTRKNYHLQPIMEAIQQIHFPKNKEVFYEARNRLVLEEFLLFIYQLRKLKTEDIAKDNHFILNDDEHKIDDFISQLPFELTSAQYKVWGEIKADLKNPQKQMSRLVQGDVGSGKTIVAVLGLILSAMNGFQGALMAPTEVLAKQHFISLSELFKEHKLPYQIELLTGSMTQKEKRLAYERIKMGMSQIVIGTHALIQQKVEYNNLALVITDEQHRFGVKQRQLLAEKGEMPHVLVMSATPIPRTLAIILYGDLDISVIDELPANRLPIKNCVVGTEYQATAYKFMKKEIEKGRQCYVICPMVEESEQMEECQDVISYAAQLQEVMGEAVNVTYLHGKMKQSQKDEIMNAFHQKYIDILVSTTVIEVGINVPNASTMLVENAERFGLAGLHQLRGRVGRGEHQSYCIFISASKSKETKQRLEILNHSNDGFHIANEDLKLRGPGDLFGIRQSGIMNFRLGDIFQDAKLLQLASGIIANLDDQEIQRIIKKLEFSSEVIL